MFIVKFFGVMDLLIAIALISAPFLDVSFRILLFSGLFLLLKKFIFKGDLLSSIDFGIGCYALLAIIFPIALFSLLAGSYLFIKGFYSTIS